MAECWLTIDLLLLWHCRAEEGHRQREAALARAGQGIRSGSPPRCRAPAESTGEEGQLTTPLPSAAVAVLAGAPCPSIPDLSPVPCPAASPPPKSAPWPGSALPVLLGAVQKEAFFPSGLQEPSATLGHLEVQIAPFLILGVNRHSCLEQIFPVAQAFQALVDPFQDWLGATERTLAQLWRASGSASLVQEAHRQVQVGCGPGLWSLLGLQEPLAGRSMAELGEGRCAGTGPLQPPLETLACGWAGEGGAPLAVCFLPGHL